MEHKPSHQRAEKPMPRSMAPRFCGDDGRILLSSRKLTCMVRAHAPPISRHHVPELWRKFCPRGIKGAGNAGRSMRPQPRVRKTKSTRVSPPQVTPVVPGIPRANGFNGFLRALPGEPGFVATIAGHDARSIAANLTPASGRQNHTTSPSAKRAFVSCAHCVHRIPRPTFVTIAKRPL
jgi:hypothetical protein